MRRRFDLTDFEWAVIEPLLPNNSRGVPRVDDRRVINGILWRFRTGSPWADVPERYGPHTTCYNRFVRWRRAGVWDRLLKAISSAFDGDIQMIDSSCVRVHQHCATGKKGAPIEAWDVTCSPCVPRSIRESAGSCSAPICWTAGCWIFPALALRPFVRPPAVRFFRL